MLNPLVMLNNLPQLAIIPATIPTAVPKQLLQELFGTQQLFQQQFK